mmetsp:Transcript_159536/g.511913  ORF Transcript_159536/g.511913 Transcript_159536/m.511913 type:complete len:117 (-) Transcript_159536:7-357(-)
MEEHARGGAHAEWPEQKREAEEVGSTDGASTAFARLAIDVSAKCMASSPGTRPSMDVVIESLEGELPLTLPPGEFLAWLGWDVLILSLSGKSWDEGCSDVWGKTGCRQRPHIVRSL